MALVRCPDCGKDVSSEAPACPGCGRPMMTAATAVPPAASIPAVPVAPTQTPKKMGPLKKGCLFAGGGIFALLFVIALMSEMARGCASSNPAPKSEFTPVPASSAAQTAGAKAAAKMAKTAAAAPAVDKYAALTKLMNDMAKTGGGLIRSYEVSDRLCYLKLDPEVWNAWTPAQQQQAMDLLAKAPVWKQCNISLVILKVYVTDVGELSGGWSGEWAFKRR